MSNKVVKNYSNARKLLVHIAVSFGSIFNSFKLNKRTTTDKEWFETTKHKCSYLFCWFFLSHVEFGSFSGRLYCSIVVCLVRYVAGYLFLCVIQSLAYLLFGVFILHSIKLYSLSRVFLTLIYSSPGVNTVRLCIYSP